MDPKIKNLLRSSLLYIVLIAFACFTLLPLIWMILTALKQPGQAMKHAYIPDGPWSSMYTFDNFHDIFFNKDFPFKDYLINSAIVAFSAAIISSTMCLMAAYAFARKNFPGKKTLFWLLLSSMMIPGMIFMVPQFAIVNLFGWMNTWAAMVIPHTANIFGVFLLRQSIEKIPKSLFEAVQVDGANDLQVLRIVVFPLVLPVVITLMLLTFLGQWSNFLWQLIVNTPSSKWLTLPVGLNLFQGQYSVQWEKMMAAASFSIIPIIIIFIFLQRFIITGLTSGGVKE